MVAFDVTGGNRIGVTLFYQELKHFEVDASQQHGPKIFIFHMTTRYRHWYIVGYYLYPDEASFIYHVIGGMGK